MGFLVYPEKNGRLHEPRATWELSNSKITAHCILWQVQGDTEPRFFFFFANKLMWSGLLEWMSKRSPPAFSGRGKKLGGGCAKWPKKRQCCWNKGVSLVAGVAVRGEGYGTEKKNNCGQWLHPLNSGTHSHGRGEQCKTSASQVPQSQPWLKSKETSSLLSSSAQNTLAQALLYKRE